MSPRAARTRAPARHACLHAGKTVEGKADAALLERVTLTEPQVQEIVPHPAIANYEDRFVIPTTHREYAEDAYDLRASCGFSFGDGCSGGPDKPSLFGGKKRVIPLKEISK